MVTFCPDDCMAISEVVVKIELNLFSLRKIAPSKFLFIFMFLNYCRLEKSWDLLNESRLVKKNLTTAILPIKTYLSPANTVLVQSN